MLDRMQAPTKTSISSMTRKLTLKAGVPTGTSGPKLRKRKRGIVPVVKARTMSAAGMMQITLAATTPLIRSPSVCGLGGVAGGNANGLSVDMPVQARLSTLMTLSPIGQK